MPARSRTNARAGTIVSVGYEGRDIDDFLDSIEAAGVDVLVDVRLTPISRKPGFSKTKLGDALAERGIEYRHMRELGNPKEHRERFHDGRVETGRRRYLRHLNNGARSTYDELVELFETRTVAVLCFELDDDHCHRRCILDQATEERPHLEVTRI